MIWQLRNLGVFPDNFWLVKWWCWNWIHAFTELIQETSERCITFEKMIRLLKVANWKTHFEKKMIDSLTQFKTSFSNWKFLFYWTICKTVCNVLLNLFTYTLCTQLPFPDSFTTLQTWCKEKNVAKNRR